MSLDFNAPDAAEPVLPSWVLNLRPLAPIASGLATIGSNPKEWLFNTLLTWVANGALEAAEYVLGWMIFVYEEISSILLTAAGPLETPASIIENAYVFVLTSVFGGLRETAMSMGLAAPVATAVALFIVVLIIVTVVYAAISVIPGSDALPSITERVQR